VSAIVTADSTTIQPTFEPRPSIEVELLADILAGLASVPTLWEPHVVHDPIERTKVRLLATPQYEIWLLGWCPGQRVDLHDHGDSAAVFQILQGALLELRLEQSALRNHRLGQGATRTALPGTIHDVLNTSSSVATSLHAYSPPLATMNFYGVGEARSEAVENVPALYDSGRLARQLHPAGRTIR
jgi:predicted metal-dependent enzyme (double-stranded beta helix superfamily)